MNWTLFWIGWILIGVLINVYSFVMDKKENRSPKGYERFLKIPILFVGPLVLLIPVAEFLIKKYRNKADDE